MRIMLTPMRMRGRGTRNEGEKVGPVPIENFAAMGIGFHEEGKLTALWWPLGSRSRDSQYSHSIVDSGGGETGGAVIDGVLLPVCYWGVSAFQICLACGVGWQAVLGLLV